MEHLELNAVIGFAGSVINGIILLPDRKSMVFALGSTIVKRDIVNPTDQQFLQGHSDRVTCMSLSPSGKYLASGQVTHLGFQADVIVWDMESLEIVHRLRLHKVRVEAVSFSCNDKWLASIGGEDDNSLVVWNLETGKAVCGSPAANDVCHTVKWARHNEFIIITAGKGSLRVWDFDLANRKVRPSDCNLGKLQRTINYVFVDDTDEFCYAGTASGDILKVNMRSRLFRHLGPKTRMSQGVVCIEMTPHGEIIAGAGDGTISVLHPESLKVLNSTKLDGGGITCIAPHTSGQLFFAATSQCSTFVVKYEGLATELRSTCHSTKIHDVVYPAGYSELFATSSKQDIRVWNARTCAELLRVQIPNLDCDCICFSRDGRAILSGWSDGKIRAFGPQSGKLLYVINDAHVGGVTAIACANDPERLVSGGFDGSVRVWRVTAESRVMLGSMKEHKATVNCIKVRGNDMEFVTASSDGSCIIWDMRRFVRNNSLFASTFFKAVLYHPDESQLLTTGTDRKITNWDAYDGSAIRIVDGSTSAEVNTLDIAGSGEFFVSGGGDKVVKLWHYDEGQTQAIGIGHSGAITKVVVSPDQRNIVSVGDEGAILIWNIPERLRDA
mmetsp:Transcript_42589/g.99981  ORF Transcript_42589/g.99981 Transcript_42589/m.99981 type:complete len:612 (+) Transcript_42589:132-1967(+)